MPHPQGSLLVYSGDSDGSAIEVWPAATRGAVGSNDLELSNLPLPEAWPHHGYVTTDACDANAILAAFEREGWRAERVYNGPPNAGFGLVRCWVENQTVSRSADEKCASNTNASLKWPWRARVRCTPDLYEWLR